MYRKDKIKKPKRKSKIGIILLNHIKNNKRGYVITTILFFIGIIIGVLFINNAQDIKIEEINKFLNELTNKIKTYENIDLTSILIESITSDFIIIIFLWFGASTIIGIPIVYGTILVKGFTIGYTISSIITCFKIWKGAIISLSIMFLHNIIFIPALLAASVSGIKLYQSIMKNKDKDYIKMEILRHTIFCVFMLVLMIISSFIESYISTNLFIMLLKKI